MKDSFRQKVYEILKTVPKGKILTYGQLAKLAGKPRAARAAGLFMRTNSDPKTIPCHRVVSSTGELTGYAFGGVAVKKEKLLSEGVEFIGDKVDLKTSQWNP